MDPARLEDWVTIHRRLDDHSDGRLRTGFEMEQTLCLRGVNFKVHWALVELRASAPAQLGGRGPARSHAETEDRLTPTTAAARVRLPQRVPAPFGRSGAIAAARSSAGSPSGRPTPRCGA